MDKVNNLKIFVVLTLLTSSLSVVAQANVLNDSTKIIQILNKQLQAWNEGNIDGFMEGYWNSDSLLFVGSNGMTYGWQNTLNNYKKSYPNKDKMGVLSFDILKLSFTGEDTAFLHGRYTLQRKHDNPSGLFTILWKKIKGFWVIIYDHTCG